MRGLKKSAKEKWVKTPKQKFQNVTSADSKTLTCAKLGLWGAPIQYNTSVIKQKAPFLALQYRVAAFYCADFEAAAPRNPNREIFIFDVIY